MARRRTEDPEMTLFPFLSVLAAVIGTLVLVISGMSKIALASPKQRIEVDAWDPSKKSPVYVECRASGLVVHPDDPTEGQPVFIDRAEIDLTGSAWSGLLTRLENDPTRYILFLVRPDGVRAFHDARATVSATNVDVGYEPLFGKGDVKFQPRRRR